MLFRAFPRRFVRINNHEHTDLQEYLGTYVTDGEGKLRFQEGALVEAVRRGYWVVLDELNLAPSDVLEALNRLLDDNRELFIPETQEVIRPHPHFLLFATQNPAGAYGGRKQLSRAFRNRFLELHVGDIPPQELVTILEERTRMAPPHCRLLVDCMKSLRERRSRSHLFAGKDGYVTPRDLLRWAQRGPSSPQEIAEEGYMLLAERLRRAEERAEVKAVLEKVCKCEVDLHRLYGAHLGSPEAAAGGDAQRRADAATKRAEKLSERHRRMGSTKGRHRQEASARTVRMAQERAEELGKEVEAERVAEWWSLDAQHARLGEVLADTGRGGEAAANAARGVGPIAWTSSLRRLFALVGRCLRHREPVLLVGDTGCGKTTVCQLYALMLQQRLRVLNCHQHTDVSDILGGLRPARGRAKAAVAAADALAKARSTLEPLLGDAGEGESTWRASLDALLARHPCLAQPGKGRDAEDEGPAADAVPPVRARDACKAAYAWLHRQLASADAEAPKVKASGLRSAWTRLQPHHTPEEGVSALREAASSSAEAARQHAALFEWQDGPLVQAMREGDLLLLDEVSLAEDAVLERLNSVLEPERSIVLTEKGEGGTSDAGAGGSDDREDDGGMVSAGSEAAKVVVAARGFRLLATMNPGGDFGKRELSPALRNRFTEIWVPPLEDMDDLLRIIQDHMDHTLRERQPAPTPAPPPASQLPGWRGLAPAMLAFLSWARGIPVTEPVFEALRSAAAGGRAEADAVVALQQAQTQQSEEGAEGAATLAQTGRQALSAQLSLRDVLAWASFVATTASVEEGGAQLHLPPWLALVHGAAMVLLDGLGLGTALSPKLCAQQRRDAYRVLARMAPLGARTALARQVQRLSGDPALAPELGAYEAQGEGRGGDGHERVSVDAARATLAAGPFAVPLGPCGAGKAPFAMNAPTTSRNLVRVLRALQLPKPILLEGSPGVGKTSLVGALAKAAGHTLVRINLSEQTDMSDLLGADLPVPAGADDGSDTGGARFAWSDGVLLRAIRNGHWVLLDELNLASQSVLEGLNACLDHRATVYVPELDEAVPSPPSFRVFAAQNPLHEGGGRKGLPASFLNRFSKVLVDPLTHDDQRFIACAMYPTLATDVAGTVEEEPSTLDRMIRFVTSLQQETMVRRADCRTAMRSGTVGTAACMTTRPTAGGLCAG